MFEGFLFLVQTEQLRAFIILEEPQMMHIPPQALFQEFLSQVKNFQGRVLQSCFLPDLRGCYLNTWLSLGHLVFLTARTLILFWKCRHLLTASLFFSQMGALQIDAHFSWENTESNQALYSPN